LVCLFGAAAVFFGAAPPDFGFGFAVAVAGFAVWRFVCRFAAGAAVWRFVCRFAAGFAV
jgi:hypothetical protein